MKTPDRQIVFAFASHPTKDPKLRWQTFLTFPPGAGPETILPMTFADGEGTPVAEGSFEFAGRRIPVADGRGSMTYAEFVAGKHAVPIWLHRPGMEPIPGGLTFE